MHDAPARRGARSWPMRLARRLGKGIDNPNLRPGEHFVHGKLLFSDNFIQRVCESPAGLVHQPPRQLSML